MKLILYYFSKKLGVQMASGEGDEKKPEDEFTGFDYQPINPASRRTWKGNVTFLLAPGRGVAWAQLQRPPGAARRAPREVAVHLLREGLPPRRDNF